MVFVQPRKVSMPNMGQQEYNILPIRPREVNRRASSGARDEGHAKWRICDNSGSAMGSEFRVYAVFSTPPEGGTPNEVTPDYF
jgi:hypothetical protein